MRKKTSLLMMIISALLLTACGSSGNNNSSNQSMAKDILLGNTLYDTDEFLDEPSGYYKDVYSQNVLIETEHAEDGTVIYEPFVYNIMYDGDKITVSALGESTTCVVSDEGRSVKFVCDSGIGTFFQWKSIGDIPRG